MSVVGGSLIGPVTNAVPCKGVFLKNLWRYLPLQVLMVLYLLVKLIKKQYSKYTQRNQLFIERDDDFQQILPQTVAVQ